MRLCVLNAGHAVIMSLDVVYLICAAPLKLIEWHTLTDVHCGYSTASHSQQLDLYIGVALDLCSFSSSLSQYVCCLRAISCS